MTHNTQLHKQMRLNFISATVLILLFSLKLGFVSAQDQKFSDIEVGLKSFVPLQYFIENNLVDGYPDSTFRPDDPVTRAEAITFIKRAVVDFHENAMPLAKDSEEKADPEDQKFPDVPADHWAAAAINFGVKYKIISGYEDGTFGPNNKINLAEAIKMVILAERTQNPDVSLEEKTNDLFNDVSPDVWFAPYVAVAKERGLLRFGFKNMIEPDQTLTRGYFFDIVFRLLKSRDPNRNFGKATFYSDSFEGLGTSNGETFTQSGYTAANKTLPFGTMVRVTNLQNGQHVDIRINDRGPFNVSLDLDLTSTAFSQIAATSEGIVPVMYEIIPNP